MLWQMYWHICFIGHNFGDYKNNLYYVLLFVIVLSVTILETTKTWEEVRLEKNRFYRSQFWRLQKPSIDALTSFLGFYRSQFWRLQKPMQATLKLLRSFIGHNFGDYKNDCYDGNLTEHVLSVTILETTKTSPSSLDWIHLFYRSQFWRLQKLGIDTEWLVVGFIGHNFGDYKNL